MIAQQTRRTVFPFPKRLLEEQLGLALLVWPAYVAFMVVVLFVVAYFREIEVSGWDQAEQGARWFAGGIGGWVGWTALPLYVTHGQTRRDFFRGMVAFVPIYGAALGLMITVTYLLEAVLYDVAGWPQEIEGGGLFDSARQFHLVFLQSWLVQMLWTAGGFLLGAGFYRSDGVGGLLVGAVIIVAGISGIGLSTDWGPFGGIYEYLFGQDSIGGVVGTGIHLALVGALAWLTWLVVRDIPIRNKND